ncbi:MAG: triosephosphate isomerase [Planctomycetes bacterium DG_23]|nr:MAG: triosephosphate isomerase [Planctomycetes bacterium DG_23]
MRKPFIAGNWKMNTTLSEARELTQDLVEHMASVELCDLAVCVPFVYLFAVGEIVKGTKIVLGAQNLHWEEKGAFTGEVSAAMLKDFGTDLVIIGHSERRHIMGESDEMIGKKLRRALDAGLRPILCLGELLEEREAGTTEEVLRRQLEEDFKNIKGEDMASVTIAYEPVWAIGTGRTATPGQAAEAHEFIRHLLAGMYNSAIAQDTRIQYGGSVKPENAYDLFKEEEIDGFLVGGASLSAEDFSKIVEEALRARDL